MITILVINSLSVPASAGVKISGIKYMGEVLAGESVTHEIILYNNVDQSADYSISINGFGQTLESTYYTLEPSEDVSPYSALSFLELDKDKVHLEPESSGSILATINVPKDAGFGGRYAIIKVQSSSEGNGNLGIGTIINVPIMLTISKSDIIKTGEITDVKMGEIVGGQPLAVSTVLKNTGNHHYYHVINQVKILDEEGNEVASSSTDPAPSAMIPTYSVRFETSFEEEFSIGEYTAHSTMMLEDGTVLDEKTASFEITEQYFPPFEETSITLTPGSPAILKDSNSRYTVSFPQGSVLSDVDVFLKPAFKSQLPMPYGDEKLGASCFRLEGVQGLLNKDAEVKVVYSNDDLEIAGGSLSMLKLAYYDEVERNWVVLPTKVNEDEMILSASTNRLGTWAVVASSTASTKSQPIKGENNQAALGGIIPLIALIGSVILCSFVKKRK